MTLSFTLGVLFSILGGASSFMGLVLQKKVVNELPGAAKRQDRGKILLKHPVWLTGLVLYIVFPSVFFMLAESLIGPVLVPGIMTSGLIVLVIGSNRIVGEQITLRDIAGISLLAAGIVLITASKLIIHYQDVDLSNKNLISRIFIFTIIMVICWLFFDLFCLLSTRHKTVLKGLASGFPYTISNLWIIILYASMFPVFHGNENNILILFFFLSSIILVVVNILGIVEIQAAFRYGDVSLAAPVQQIPIQIVPVLYFYYVFQGEPTGSQSLILIISGILSILFSGFILTGKRQSLETI